MSTDQSIHELITSRVELNYGEAVAIVQELIAAVPTDGRAVPPFGPPSVDNVRIYPDGSVECLACGSTPAVSEIARLLEAMLPRRATSRVPGGLRYTIARALLEVDAPPFDSLDALSAALSRHEQGERSDIVRELCARAARPKVVEFRHERRRAASSATELRRHLRQADEALFQRTHAEPPARVEKAALLDAEPLIPRHESTGVLLKPERPAAHRWLLAGAAAVLIAFASGYAVVDEINELSRRSRAVSRASLSAPSSSTVVSTKKPTTRVTPSQNLRGTRVDRFASICSASHPSSQRTDLTSRRTATA